MAVDLLILNKLMKLKPNRYYEPIIERWLEIDFPLKNLAQARTIYSDKFYRYTTFCQKNVRKQQIEDGTIIAMDYTIRVLKRENTFEHNKEHFEFINDDICILKSVNYEHLIIANKTYVRDFEIDYNEHCINIPICISKRICCTNNECIKCPCRDRCIESKIGHKIDHRIFTTYFRIGFEPSEFDKVVQSVRLKQNQEIASAILSGNNNKSKATESEKTPSIEIVKTATENQVPNKEESAMETAKTATVDQISNKEESTMEKKVSIWEQVYEHSPKENVEIVKEWAEKYKPTLKWLLPVVSIYAAYRVLNSKESKLKLENISNICKEKLGCSLECLENKSELKELVRLGGVIAGAYALTKIPLIINSKNTKEITREQIEEQLDKIESKKNFFTPIVKRAEPILPVAVSVLIVYVMTQKPNWLEKAETFIGEELMYKVKLYFDMAKTFVLEKLKIDTTDAEKAKKVKIFGVLAVVVVVAGVIYGRQIFGKRAVIDENDEENKKLERNEKFEALIAQITSIMEKMLPTAYASIITVLIAKNIIKESEVVDATGEIIEDEVVDITD